MAISAAISKTHEQLKRTCAKLDERTKKLDAEVKKREGKVKEAIATGDTMVIEVQKNAIRADLTQTEKLLADADNAMFELDTLKRDETFMEEKDDEADRLAKIIANTRHKTALHFKTLKKLENDLDDAWRKSHKSEDYLVQRLARLNAGVKGLYKDLKERHAKLDKAAEKAYAAQQKGDAKALAAAKSAVAAVDGPMAKVEYDIYVKVIKDTKADFDAEKDMSKETRATLKDGLEDIDREMVGAKSYMDGCVMKDKDVKALAIEKVDIDKALGALGIDAKHKAKLAKALSGPPSGYEKALTALSKELKLGTDGKKMLESLKRAGLIKE